MGNKKKTDFNYLVAKKKQEIQVEMLTELKIEDREVLYKECKKIELMNINALREKLKRTSISKLFSSKTNNWKVLSQDFPLEKEDFQLVFPSSLPISKALQIISERELNCVPVCNSKNTSEIIGVLTIKEIGSLTKSNTSHHFAFFFLKQLFFFFGCSFVHTSSEALSFLQVGEQ